MRNDRAELIELLDLLADARKLVVDRERTLLRFLIESWLDASKLPSITAEGASVETLPKWLTKKQAAEYAQVSEGTIDKWRRSGELRCGYAGADPRYTKEDLDAYLTRHYKKTEPEQKTLCYSVAAPQAAATRRQEQPHASL